jgi:hypothetical protein
MRRVFQAWTVAAALCALGATGFLSGCGMEAAPQPPSLKLPNRVTDLSAVRAGNQVTLTWTMPKRDTDKVALKGPVTVAVCRREENSTQNWAQNSAQSSAQNNACQPAGQLSVAPGAKGQFVEALPVALASGAPRGLVYFVELKNRRGRSAGLSNAAALMAGAAPAPVESFAASSRKNGVALEWAAGDRSEAVRLYRKLISAPAKKAGEKKSGPLSAPRPREEQKLLVDSDSGRALDTAVEYGSVYEYRAQRVARVMVDGETVELGGEITAPSRIDFEDVFPPAVPQGLAAVATAANGQTPAAIDLSWLPGTDRNLAGYAVYRREGNGNWERISSAAPVIGPAFHDPSVQSGHTYRYAVTAISQTGHESQRSEEAEETVPASE